MNFFSLFKRNIIYKLKKKISIDENNLLESSLDDLFHYYGSDKANVFKIENREGHGYSKLYIKHLDHLKNQLSTYLEALMHQVYLMTLILIILRLSLVSWR